MKQAQERERKTTYMNAACSFTQEDDPIEEENATAVETNRNKTPNYEGESPGRMEGEGT